MMRSILARFALTCSLVFSFVYALRVHNPGKVPERDWLDEDRVLPDQDMSPNLKKLVDASSLFRIDESGEETVITRHDKLYKCCVRPGSLPIVQDVTDENWLLENLHSHDCSFFEYDWTKCECMFGDGWLSFDSKQAKKETSGRCVVTLGHLAGAMGFSEHELKAMTKLGLNYIRPLDGARAGDNPTILEFDVLNGASSRTGFTFYAGAAQCWAKPGTLLLAHQLDGNVFVQPDENNFQCPSKHDGYDYYSRLDVHMRFGSKLAGIARLEGFGRTLSNTVSWTYFCVTVGANKGWGMSCNSRGPKHSIAHQGFTVRITGGPAGGEEWHLPYDAPNGNLLRG